VTPVRPLDIAGQDGGCSNCTTTVPESLSDFSRPWNQNTPKTQPARKKNPSQTQAEHLQNRQEQTSTNTTQKHTDSATHPRQIPKRAQPVRPVKSTGQTGVTWAARDEQNPWVNSPNPNSYLSNRSTVLCKTLGIVGTPHRESIAKFMSTETCQIKRNRRNPATSSSNPRAPKTPKSIPLTREFGRGIKCKRTTKGSHKFPPPNSQEQGPENTPRNPPRDEGPIRRTREGGVNGSR
jgi:hypothetical protein